MGTYTYLRWLIERTQKAIFRGELDCVILRLVLCIIRILQSLFIILEMRRGKGETEAAGERRESLTWVSPHQMEIQSRLQQ